MKPYNSYILVVVLTLFISSVQAQTINWASLKDNKHIINANLGAEHGVVYGFGYGYQIKTRFLPIIANIELSAPTGNKTFDEFKTKIGGQIRLIKYQSFQFSTRIHGVYRSYENGFVRLQNFGSDLSGIIGYYRPKWFVSGEFGFDKAIVTHFKHAKAYKDQYTGVVDGWYEPATGGNLNYGLQAGVSFKKYDVYLRAGKMLTQDFETTPLVPLYGQLGCNLKF
jgi:hypothetical protein